MDFIISILTGTIFTYISTISNKYYNYAVIK